MCLGLTADGTKVVVGYADTSIRIYDLETEEVSFSFFYLFLDGGSRGIRMFPFRPTRLKMCLKCLKSQPRKPTRGKSVALYCVFSTPIFIYITWAV